MWVKIRDAGVSKIPRVGGGIFWIARTLADILVFVVSVSLGGV